MDSVKEISIIFCGAAVLSGAVGLLLDGWAQKTVRYITALILLASVTTGIVRADWNLELSKTSAAESVSASTEFSILEYQAEYTVGEILKKNAVEYKEITVNATKGEDGSIIINEITVKGADNKEKAAELLASVGIDCRVIFK